ncbi:hypothetical protein MTHERMOG20_15610 [Moorella thermoacetica]|uniref:Uncharacterized protein n=1 Tax=Neomoorella thermoacetica TaxID=1525 RepID=A0A1J5JX58_NEOTH|nr:hypothetical protein [Moorella thermoacetica]AKX95205.1 hypothetical protein MOTHE_c24260 [Moorella thermoacetica]AKX97830.1 hypothetical protein MOTHA_c24980 [Moorella thermoacetica]OIQ10008.1 hypothetical protein MOOR_00780 [Moorella thermoacetica]OIQ56661.1 hypothetical protein MOCA_12380 [Moorella thermoacetica]OIQ62532.1 hypothetical protein MTIN_07720 [Moorella thermoacetica]
MDLNIEKFFDRVNYDILMARVARKVMDKMAIRCCLSIELTHW